MKYKYRFFGNNIEFPLIFRFIGNLKLAVVVVVTGVEVGVVVVVHVPVVVSLVLVVSVPVVVSLSGVCRTVRV